MLQSALPHAVATKRAERHAYQAQVVDTFRNLLAETEAQLLADVATAEVSVSDWEKSKEQHGERLEAAQKEEADRREQKQAFEDACVQAEADKAAADSALVGAKEASAAAQAAADAKSTELGAAKDVFAEAWMV